MEIKERFEMPLNKEEREALSVFNALWMAACAGASEDELKAIAPDYKPGRIQQIAHAATMPIGDIVKMIGSQNDFSLHYCISKRTVQSWAATGKGECPPHLRLLFCRDLKLI